MTETVQALIDAIKILNDCKFKSAAIDVAFYKCSHAERYLQAELTLIMEEGK